MINPMDERRRYEQIWKPIAVRDEPPEGDIADELRAWLRDASPEDLWHALRSVYAGSRAERMGYRRSPKRLEEPGSVERAAAAED